MKIYLKLKLFLQHYGDGIQIVTFIRNRIVDKHSREAVNKTPSSQGIYGTAVFVSTFIFPETHKKLLEN